MDKTHKQKNRKPKGLPFSVETGTLEGGGNPAREREQKGQSTK